MPCQKEIGRSVWQEEMVEREGGDGEGSGVNKECRTMIDYQKITQSKIKFAGSKVGVAWDTIANHGSALLSALLV